MQSRSNEEVILDALQLLAVVFYQEFTADRQAVYASLLMDYDAKAVAEACTILARSVKYLPVPAEIITEIHELSGEKMAASEARDWYIHEYRCDVEPTTPWQRMAIRAGASSGLDTHFDTGLVADRKWVFKKFDAHYNHLAEHGEAQRLTLPAKPDGQITSGKVKALISGVKIGGMD